ncbi:MAG: hypothetical protein QN183_13700 [Armatimonadota bacterium]|nr:hypothetical protein [Armatimonadota bacterium]
MIADRIRDYLDNSRRAQPDETVLQWATRRFTDGLRRRMGPDRDMTGRLYATLVTQRCARRAAYKYHGVAPDAPLPARAVLNYYVGDIAELAVLALAKAAGCDLAAPDELLLDTERMRVSRNGLSFGCWPDAVLHVGGAWYNVEVKKMAEASYDQAKRDGGPDDTWGYRTQASLEVAAWREAGIDVRATVLVALRGLTGELGEWVLPYDDALVEQAFARAAQVRDSTPDLLPDRAHRPTTCPDGRQRLPVQCAYCSYTRRCWPTARRIVERGRPAWYVDTAGSAGHVGDDESAGGDDW